MNYRPLIFFREIRNHEIELMKNAESILKELGFKIKTTSPHRDDRMWEIEFSDDGAKEVYIEFRDDADELHSPVVIIDQILTDKIETIDGDGAYYSERVVDEQTLINTIENESYETIRNMIPDISDEEIDNLKNKLKDGTQFLLNELFKHSMVKERTVGTGLDNIERSINQVFSDFGAYTKQDLINDLNQIQYNDDDAGNQIIDYLLQYIDDPELVEKINTMIESMEDDDDEDDDDDDYMTA